MFEADARDHGDVGVDHVRRVHAAPHPDLDDGEIALAVAEVLERDCGRDLEERRMVHAVGARHRLDRRLHARPDAQDVPVGDRLPVHADPLVEPHEVRGGVQSDVVARLLQGGRRIRADGPFPVRPGDVDRPEAAMGIADERQEPPDVVEPELDPEPLELVQAVQGRLDIHGGDPGQARTHG